MPDPLSGPLAATPAPALARTALHALHAELGARFVPFAGYDMPVQYPAGVLKEHLHTRNAASLFDVSHMGQLVLRGGAGNNTGNLAAQALEALVPADIVGLAPGMQRYTFFTSESGGLLDDLMVTAAVDHLFLVVNAACKTQDIAHLHRHLGSRCALAHLAEHALLALQGPASATVMQRLLPDTDLAGWRFMTARHVEIGGASCFVTRSGYTGEDGFEISIPNAQAEAFARRLLAQPEVQAAGLGARDSLRLEAGLCLYGHDIDDSTSPVEAGLIWAIAKARRAQGERAGGFPGAGRILDEITHGTTRKRVGLAGIDKTPVREGATLADAGGRPIGQVTSGGFGPSFGGPVAMGYVETAFAVPGTEIFATVRGKPVAMRVAAMPFVAHRYYRG